jgi:predicted DNA-binding protein
MSAPARQEAMLRKPILMPPDMIKRVDKIAKNKKASFAAIVREAVNAFDGEIPNTDAAILEALADTLISGVRGTVDRMKSIEKKMDETHRMLEAQSGN